MNRRLLCSLLALFLLFLRRGGDLRNHFIDGMVALFVQGLLELFVLLHLFQIVHEKQRNFRG